MNLRNEYESVSHESRVLEKTCSNYIHSGFQCLAVAKVVADAANVTVMSAPTGSGKTFIAALIAKCFHA